MLLPDSMALSRLKLMEAEYVLPQLRSQLLDPNTSEPVHVDEGEMVREPWPGALFTVLLTTMSALVAARPASTVNFSMSHERAQEGELGGADVEMRTVKFVCFASPSPPPRSGGAPSALGARQRAQRAAGAPQARA